MSGEEFAERAFIQVLRFGATLLAPSTAVGLSRRGDGYVIRLQTGENLTARCVIVATGVTYRRWTRPALYPFQGAGVFYTPLGAQDEVHPGHTVMIVGGGNSAGQAAAWLADHGCRVTIVISGDNLAASMSQYLLDRIAQQPEIAAGDVRSGSVKRVASAAGEGSIAVRFVSEHLGRRAGFTPAPTARRPD